MKGIVFRLKSEYGEPFTQGWGIMIMIMMQDDYDEVTIQICYYLSGRFHTGPVFIN